MPNTSSYRRPTFAPCLPPSTTDTRRNGADTAAAAAFTLATLTAWRMVVTRARVAAGESVLIWGIGGGVAQAALQIAKARGARVWVTSGHDDKLRRAAELGADETINHRATDVGRAIRDRTGKRGVDVVIDSVGHASWAQSLTALGRAGRLVTCGATSGPMVETDLRRMFWNQWTLMGSTMGNEAEFDAIAAEFRAGRLRPVVDDVCSTGKGPGGVSAIAVRRAVREGRAGLPRRMSDTPGDHDPPGNAEDGAEGEGGEDDPCAVRSRGAGAAPGGVGRGRVGELPTVRRADEPPRDRRRVVRPGLRSASRLAPLSAVPPRVRMFRVARGTRN